VKRKLLWMMLVCLVVVFSSQLIFGTGKYVIKFGYSSPELTPTENFETGFITAFKAYVEKESKGSIKVESYPAGQ
jgi:TRAP-type C4-dicarboxylate transport system substrate-binding protein